MAIVKTSVKTLPAQEGTLPLRQKYRRGASYKVQKSPANGNNLRKSTQPAGFRHLTLRAVSRRGGNGLDLTLRNPVGK